MINYDEYEKNLLSQIKSNPDFIDEFNISDTIFTGINITLFSVINRLHKSGNTVSSVSIIDQIEKNGYDIKESYVLDLNLFSDANIEFYVEKLRERFIRKEFYNLGLKLQDLSKSEDVDKLHSITENSLRNILNTKGCGEVKHVKEFLNDVINDIEYNYKNPGVLKGISSGYSDLDELTGGFKNEEYTVIAARPSIGKTAFAINMAIGMVKNGVNVGFFSAEMSAVNIIKRIIAVDNEINLYCINSGEALKKSDFTKMTETFSQLDRSGLWFDETPNIKLKQLKANSRDMARKGVQIIFIDYLTLINYEKNVPRHEKIGEISKQLKQLARELKIPIIALSQVKREAEGKRPCLADLRQSGEIEEDADVIIFLHRERDFVKNEIETYGYVDKDRNGATGDVSFTFMKKYTKFKEIKKNG